MIGPCIDGVRVCTASAMNSPGMSKVELDALDFFKAVLLLELLEVVHGHESNTSSLLCSAANHTAMATDGRTSPVETSLRDLEKKDKQSGPATLASQGS